MTPTRKRCVIIVRQRHLLEVVKVVQLGIGSRRVRNAVKNEDKLQLSHFKLEPCMSSIAVMMRLRRAAFLKRVRITTCM